MELKPVWLIPAPQIYGVMHPENIMAPMHSLKLKIALDFQNSEQNWLTVSNQRLPPAAKLRLFC